MMFILGALLFVWAIVSSVDASWRSSVTELGSSRGTGLGVDSGMNFGGRLANLEFTVQWS